MKMNISQYQAVNQWLKSFVLKIEGQGYEIPDDMQQDLLAIELKSYNIDFMKANTWRPWSSFEGDLTAVVYQALQLSLQFLLGNIDDVESNSSYIWESVAGLFKRTVEPVLLNIATKAVDDIVEQLGASELTISYDLTNQNAQNYALLWQALSVKTDRKAVTEAILQWRASGENLEYLSKILLELKDATGMPLFSMERAERIARSEAPSIYSGAKAYALEANGYPKVSYLPKAHVGCRCYIQPGKMQDGTKVVIWYTAKDELVCKQELETPWGVVKGCRELHRTIISENMAGQKWSGNIWSPKK